MRHALKQQLDIANFDETGQIIRVRAKGPGSTAPADQRLFSWGVVNPTASNTSKFYINLADTTGSQTLWQNTGTVSAPVWIAMGAGTIVQNIKTVTAAYIATLADGVIVADATGGAFNVTLPPVATSKNARLTIKRKNAGANAVTVLGNAAELIDGNNAFALAAQYQSIDVECDGAQWWII